MKKRKVVLVLGGGAARGLANIGVLKVLNKEKVPIDLIIGSSMGALVGATYSLGATVSQIEKEAESFTWNTITDMTLPRVAVLRGKKMARLIERLTAKRTFDDCRIPLAITATDIETGGEILFTSGDLQKVIAASCSWPGIFPPVSVNGQQLCDGGIRNSVPTKWAKDMGATFVIAVRVGFAPQRIQADNIFQLMVQSIQIMGEELDKYQSMQADVIVEPKLRNISQLDFHKAQEIIYSGEEAAEKVLRHVKRGIEKWTF